MFQQENIMLLTVVELIFALLVSFFFIVYLIQKHNPIPEPKNDTTVAELLLTLGNTEKDLGILKIDLKKAKEDLATANANLEKDKIGLKSKQTPSCIEKGISRGGIAEIKILGSDKYAVRDGEYSFQELRTIFDKEIVEAQRADCIHSVNVSADKHLSSQEYDEGLRKLEQLFYVKRLKIR